MIDNINKAQDEDNQNPIINNCDIQFKTFPNIGDYYMHKGIIIYLKIKDQSN